MNRHTLPALAAVLLFACADDATGPVTSFSPTQLDAGDTASTDLGTVPDSVVDQSDTDDQELNHSDAQTDGGSAPDLDQSDAVDQELNHSDAEPDTGPQSLCTSPFDSAPMEDREALQTLAWECLVDCGRDVAPDDVLSCTTSCVDDGSELTPGCSTCHAELAECGLNEGCFEDCAEDATGWECAHCQWTECRAEFFECAGVPAWRTEPGCEEGQGYRHNLGWECAGTTDVIDGDETLEECLEGRVSESRSDECRDCVVDYNLEVAAACPACLEDSWCKTACVSCIAESSASLLERARFCSGSGPTSMSDDDLCD